MPVTEERADEAQHLPMPVSKIFNLPKEEEDRLNVLVDIMASLCPNLETLHTDVGDPLRVAFRLCMPGSMLRLRTIDMRCDDYAKSGVVMRMKYLARLFRAAPNIADTTLHICVLRVSDLVIFLSVCPNLEAFKYEAG
ncbi:hypothetical protein N657DRAFT_681171 [Parathielavia appendiculata]|uniref:Uncharacterized protein n=1 Tax=Parathielavia appendiculata TaxID=2587402 RepID=A0AAN6TYD7_9PEZI|nr:hypothetical protein N657DRAFT_681171 [Parathielavia appendiculata]